MNTPTAPILKDIHLPNGIEWWPPAPGWWALGFFLVVLVVLGFFAIRFVRKQWRKRQPYREANRVLLQIENTYASNQDKTHLLQQLSTLLRQTAMSYFGRPKVAGLTGQPWLVFLDTHLPGQHFTAGDGRALAQLPYAASAQTLDAPSTIALVKRWIHAAHNRR